MTCQSSNFQTVYFRLLLCWIIVGCGHSQLNFGDPKPTFKLSTMEEKPSASRTYRGKPPERREHPKLFKHEKIDHDKHDSHEDKKEGWRFGDHPDDDHKSHFGGHDQGYPHRHEKNYHDRHEKNHDDHNHHEHPDHLDGHGHGIGPFPVHIPHHNNLKISQNICALRSDPGYCNLILYRWYYDYRYHRCMPYLYTGCGGNTNNFRSQKSCEKETEHCHPVWETLLAKLASNPLNPLAQIAPGLILGG